MSLKTIVLQQYRKLVDPALRLAEVHSPPEGWIRTVRKALGMSAAQLARKMEVTRARIDFVEKAEQRGAVTLKSMQAAAEAMGCRFVYAIVPETSVEDLVARQARKKALALVRRASVHMALEDQAISDSKTSREVRSLAEDMARNLPRDFWNDDK